MRKVVKISEVGGIDDTLVFVLGRDGSAYIEVDNAWTGDTESGFGRSASITLTKDQARELAEALQKWAAS